MLGATLLSLLACDGCTGPDTGWDPADGDACLSCHEGVELAHPDMEGECAGCHGGDPLALTKEGAHVPIPDNWAELRGDLAPAPDGFIKDFAPDLLDQLDPAYVRFINPGDIRAADEACGGCHADHVATVQNSIMTTNAGHYMPTRYYAGLQDREAIYGSHPAFDPAWTGDPGSSQELITLPPPTRDELEAALLAAEGGDTTEIEAMAWDHYLAKNCNTCHAGGYPKNNSAALYRSTGCTSCHMVYAEDGVYQGNDPTISTSTPVHPRTHELTTAIPTEQCATCHFQGGRIGLLYRGIREGGFSADQTPPNAEFWDSNVYGHVAGFYILDEDTTNSYDETPPDVHYQMGMECADCHVGSEVHGDGRLYATSKSQQSLRCEDCHGTVRESIVADADGVYRTSEGRDLPQLSQNDQGQVILTGVMDGEPHVVTQVAERLDAAGPGSAMHAGMGVDENGWSHTDDLTCDTCHNSYQQQCMGCHVGMDLRLSQVDYQTGTKTPGLTTGSREWTSLDHIILCQAEDGRAQSCQSSQQAQLTVRDFDGELVVGTEDEGVFRENDDYSGVIGWSPFFQHTTSRSPRTCDTCHRTDDSEAEYDRVRGVYGYGTGEYVLTGAHGESIDALQFIDANGNQVTDFVHPGTGPLESERIERALSVEVQ